MLTTWRLFDNFVMASFLSDQSDPIQGMILTVSRPVLILNFSFNKYQKNTQS